MKEFIPNELPLEIPISENMYKLLVTASRALSELRGIARTIPNRFILINALVLQEAKDSSEIENIITTHDELFLSQVDKSKMAKATKEVQDYGKALQIGFWLILISGSKSCILSSFIYCSKLLIKRTISS